MHQPGPRLRFVVSRVDPELAQPAVRGPTERVHLPVVREHRGVRRSPSSPVTIPSPLSDGTDLGKYSVCVDPGLDGVVRQTRLAVGVEPPRVHDILRGAYRERVVIARHDGRRRMRDVRHRRRGDERFHFLQSRQPSASSAIFASTRPSLPFSGHPHE